MTLKQFMERLRHAREEYDFRRLNLQYNSEEMKDFSRFMRLNEEQKLHLMEMSLEAEAARAEADEALAQIASEMSALDYMEAMADSFAGGPGPSDDAGNPGEASSNEGGMQ